MAEHNKKAKGGGSFNQGIYNCPCVMQVITCLLHIGYGTQNAAVYSSYSQHQQPHAHAAGYGYGCKSHCIVVALS